MTEAQLDHIETAVGFTLPPDYRRVAAASPFRPIGRDCIYWFYDDPDQVIAETLAPLADGDYNGDGWRKGYLTIGNSAAGDLYVLDTATEGLPVLCLSHETHQIEPECSSFEAFVAEWLRAPDEVERRLAAEAASVQATQGARMRRGLLITGVLLVICLALPLIWGLLVAR